MPLKAFCSPLNSGSYFSLIFVQYFCSVFTFIIGGPSIFFPIFVRLGVAVPMRFLFVFGLLLQDTCVSHCNRINLLRHFDT